MKTSLLKGIIYGQRQIIREAKIIPREYSFDPNFNYVLVGLRRAGKSTLLYKVAQDLVKNGVDWDQIIYVNFEDERLLDFTVNDFNDIVLTANEITPKKHYYFFDEIQNIDGWEYFARRMADEKQYVYITGSNAKMLSGDIQTHLGGRYMIKHIAPFNFREYLTAKNIRHDEEALYTTALNGQIRGAMNAYLKDGGLPETINAIEKRDYLNNIYNNVLLRDVVYKNGVRSPEVLRNLIKKLSESVMQDVTYNRLAKLLTQIGHRENEKKVSPETIIDYLDYAKEAYLIFDIENYVARFAERKASPKYYFTDNGILNLFLFDKNATLLENVVAIVLHNKYKDDVYFLKSAKTKIDIDFYLPEHSKAIQVTWELSETDKKREIGNLVKLHQTNPEIKDLIIVTAEDEDEIQVGDCEIQVIPVYKFLLKN